MAITKDKVIHFATGYCGGLGQDEHWTTSFGDPTWERNGKDSGKIKIALSGYHAYRYIQWITPRSNGTWLGLTINGTEHITGGKGSLYNDCTGNDSSSASASGTAELIQTSDNPYSNLKYNITCYWVGASGNTNTFTFQGDIGEWCADYNLNNNFKILPPKNLTGSITSKSTRKVTATCNLGSWSDNVNITGTPYTGDGGRDWNFKAEIIYNGTVYATRTVNTGEAKTATFTFDDASELDNVPIGENAILRFTASNNYQQSITYDVTFQFDFLGWVVENGSTKKIRYIARVAEADEAAGNGEVTWSDKYSRIIT